MKNSILVTILATSVLAGCSSTGSSGPSNPAPQEWGADVTVDEESRTAEISGDEGNSAVIVGDNKGNADITLNDQEYVVEGNVIFNDKGEPIGSVEKNDGYATAYIYGKAYTLSVSDGRLTIKTDNNGPDFGGGMGPGEDLPAYGNGDWGDVIALKLDANDEGKDLPLTLNRKVEKLTAEQRQTMKQTIKSRTRTRVVK